MGAASVAQLAAIPQAVPLNIAFAIISIVMVASAIKVVTTDNVVHAALWLVLVLLGVAANFLLLQAEFVAITQLLVYVGAIIVLFLFGVMLTRAELGESDDLTIKSMRPAAAAVAVVLVGILGYSIVDTYRSEELTFAAYSYPAQPQLIEPGEPVVEGDPGAADHTQVVADSIFGDYLLPFEIVSVLLLVALIGAIVLARKE